MSIEKEAIITICKLNAGDRVTKRDWANLLKHFKQKNPYMNLRLLKSLLREQGIPVPKDERKG